MIYEFNFNFFVFVDEYRISYNTVSSPNYDNIAAAAA